jgi:hypothetical protein
LLDELNPQRTLRWAGEGAHFYRQQIKEKALESGLVFADDSGGTFATGHGRRWDLARQTEYLAYNVGALALRYYESGDGPFVTNWRALYVRPSDAELKVVY